MVGAQVNDSPIADGLVQLCVPIGTLSEDPRNVRIHDKRNMDVIKSSLSRFGQRVPLVARKDTGTVIAGNARLVAARELGWSEVAVLYVEDDDATATAYALVDNRSSDLSAFDQAGLAEVLATLKGGDLEIDEIGWNETEIEEILSAFTDDLGGAEDPAGEGAAGGTVKRCFVFTEKEDELVEGAISKEMGSKKSSSRGSALAAICGEFVE